MNMFRKLIILQFIFWILVTLCWSGSAITIDGIFEDWAIVPVAHSDSSGDGTFEDFAELKITNDKDFLFLKIRFYDGEHLLQDLNAIRVYIDTDNNIQSGLKVNGIGADIEWCFGCRLGVYHNTTGQETINQNDIVLRSAPTVTSREFEIALGLNSDPMTLGRMIIPDSIMIFLSNSNNLDLLPDQHGGARYSIDTDYPGAPISIPLKREDKGHVRVLSYNTLGNGLLDLNRQAHFQRIIQSLKPDILAFQEQGNASQSISLIRDWLQERYMYGVGLGNNNLIVSRYPILKQALLTASGRTMAVLLQTDSVLEANLLILNSHLACCTNNASRQHDADEIIMVLRKWRDGNIPFPIPENTPIIHLGDFNLVGSSQQLKTLTEGDIVNEEIFGSDFYPDWDNSALADLFSLHNSIRMGYTWRDDRNEFSPGKLDYILYTDNVIDLGNHFILNTMAMSDNDLEKYRLLKDDTNRASDHLPRIMDVASVKPVFVQENPDIPDQFHLYQAFPNPFNPVTTIRYSIPEATNVTLIVFDVLGHQVSVLVDEYKGSGSYTVEFDGTGLASGVYYYILKDEKNNQIKKMTLLK